MTALASRLRHAGVSGWKTGLEFPNALNTGPAAGGYTSLTPVSGTQTIPATAPYPSWVTVNGDGTLTVTGISFNASVTSNASNITFRGCQFVNTGIQNVKCNSGTSGYSFEYCQFRSAGLLSNQTCDRGIFAPGVSGLSIDRCDFFWHEQSINLGSDSNVSITNCFLHDVRFLAADHTELIYLPGNQSNITIAGNTILNGLGQTAAVYISQDNAGPYSNVLVDGNLIAGGGFAMYLGNINSPAISGFVVSNNWFSTAYYPLSGKSGTVTAKPTWDSNGNAWTNNRWYDGPSAGQLIPQ
jgi:parallel beta helix pectate lyase-like protein